MPEDKPYDQRRSMGWRERQERREAASNPQGGQIEELRAQLDAARAQIDGLSNKLRELETWKGNLRGENGIGVNESVISFNDPRKDSDDTVLQLENVGEGVELASLDGSLLRVATVADTASVTASLNVDGELELTVTPIEGEGVLVDSLGGGIPIVVESATLTSTVEAYSLADTPAIDWTSVGNTIELLFIYSHPASGQKLVQNLTQPNGLRFFNLDSDGLAGVDVIQSGEMIKFELIATNIGTGVDVWREDEATNSGMDFTDGLRLRRIMDDGKFGIAVTVDSETSIRITSKLADYGGGEVALKQPAADDGEGWRIHTVAGLGNAIDVSEFEGLVTINWYYSLTDPASADYLSPIFDLNNVVDEGAIFRSLIADNNGAVLVAENGAGSVGWNWNADNVTGGTHAIYDGIGTIPGDLGDADHQGARFLKLQAGDGISLADSVANEKVVIRADVFVTSEDGSVTIVEDPERTFDLSVEGVGGAVDVTNIGEPGTLVPGTDVTTVQGRQMAAALSAGGGTLFGVAQASNIITYTLATRNILALVDSGGTITFERLKVAAIIDGSQSEWGIGTASLCTDSGTQSWKVIRDIV